MPEGGVTNEQCTVDAKLHSGTSKVIDLSASENTVAASVLLPVYDALRDICIESIELMYVTETAAAAATLNIGTTSNTAAVVAAYATSATATVSDANNATLPLATTLRNLARYPSRGKPILPKGSRLILLHAGSGAAGEIVITVKYFYLDRQTTNA